jgi:hypothetical protein
MMEKISPGWGGWGVHAHPLSLSFSITHKFAVYAPAERTDTLPVIHLYPYVLCGPSVEVHGTFYTATVYIFKASSL